MLAARLALGRSAGGGSQPMAPIGAVMAPIGAVTSRVKPPTAPAAVPRRARQTGGDEDELELVQVEAADVEDAASGWADADASGRAGASTAANLASKDPAREPL